MDMILISKWSGWASSTLKVAGQVGFLKKNPTSCPAHLYIYIYIYLSLEFLSGIKFNFYLLIP